MKPFYLSEITTKDGLIHQGIFFKPTKPAARAVLWAHGLTSSFYSGIPTLGAFAEACDANGWGFASFNSRGHDGIAGVRKADPKNPKGYGYLNAGAGYEVFEECVFDVHAGVDFLVSQGFSDVVIVGHSTGATKACFSEGTRPHKNVSAVVLAGALSDRLGPDVDKEKVAAELIRMEKMIHEGRGDELVNGLSFFPMTPKRFVSLYKKGSAEDVFDYDDANGLKVFSQITKPLFVIIPQNDENLNQPAAGVVAIFDRHAASKTYKSMVFPDSLHSFNGKEKEFAQTVVEWVKTL